MWKTLLLLFLGVMTCSTSVILIKKSAAHPTHLAAYRLLFAALLLSPLFFRAWRRHRADYSLRHVARTALPGLVLAVHFISWNYGARQTLSGNASLLVNMTPVVMPFLLFAIIREVINRSELAGTCIAMGGVILLVISDFVWSRDHAAGDLVCFGSMTLFAVYLVLARLNRDFIDLWLYLIPLYLFASLFSFLAAALWPGVDAFMPQPRQEIFIMLLAALIPTITGHSLLNYSMKHLRGQLVAICNSSQFIFATVLGLWVIGDVPKPMFYPASLLIVGGSVLAIRSTRSA